MRQIRNAAIFGIVSAFAAMPVMLFELLKSMDKLGSLMPLYVLSYAIYTVTYVLFVRGFVLIGKKMKVPMLVKASYWMIVFGVSSSLLMIAGADALLYSIILLLLLGAVTLFFGIALLRLKKLGGIARAAGILNIVSGASMVVFIFAFLALILMVPAYILEIILLFRAAKK
ncbi:MAG: hypothetical protein ABH879_04380 [archaeon]